MFFAPTSTATRISNTKGCWSPKLHSVGTQLSFSKLLHLPKSCLHQRPTHVHAYWAQLYLHCRSYCFFVIAIGSTQAVKACSTCPTCSGKGTRNCGSLAFKEICTKIACFYPQPSWGKFDKLYGVF